MSGDIEEPTSLRDRIAEFLVEKCDGSALASEISSHLMFAWSADDIWHLARANPHLFDVGEGDHELPPDTRIVRLARMTA